MKVVAYKRAEMGTGASRRLRASGMTLGIVYGGNSDPVSIKLDHNTLFYALKKEEFHSSILDLELDGVTEKVLLRDFQTHAYKPLILHVDFQRVDANQKITMRIPLHFINEENSEAGKVGAIHHATTELEISCLPADLPAFIEVDLSELKVGDSIHLGSLNMPAGVTATSHDATLPIITTALAAEEPEDEPEASTEAPAEEAAPSTEA